MLNDNRVSLRFVPQEGDNSVSNETTLHEDIDEGVISLPDVDDAEKLISSSPRLTPAQQPAVTSIAEHDGSSPAGHQDVDPSSLPTAPSLITASLQPVSSCDVTMEDSEDISAYDAIHNEASLQECSQVVSPTHSATSDVSLELGQARCNDGSIALQEVTLGSPQPTTDKDKLSNASSSHTPDVVIITDTTSPPSVAVQNVTDSNAPSSSSSSSSSSVALPNVTTLLQAVGDDKDTAGNATGPSMTAEQNDNSDSTTPAKDAKQDGAPLTDKDEIKVIIIC